MGTTSPDDLGYPDVGYASGIRQAVKDLADTTQTALLARAGRTFRVADSTALAALSGSYTLRAGDNAYQVDTGVFYRYSGTAWLTSIPGQYGVVPTSVSGTSVTVDSFGKVSFSTATTVTLAGVFTSQFSNYRVTFDITTTAAVDIIPAFVGSATGYDRSFGGNANSSFSGGTSLNQAGWGLIASGIIGETAGYFELYNPARAVATTGIAVAGTTANPMVAASSGQRTQYWLHRSLTAYSDMTISVSSGTISGTVRVVGLN